MVKMIYYMCMNKKTKSFLLDYIDALIGVICLGVLLWIMRWFPFNGALDRYLPPELRLKRADAKQQATPGQPAQPKQTPIQLALPATYEEIAKAFVSICPGPSQAPFGSGVFIGQKTAETNRIFLVSAAHVAWASYNATKTNSVCFVVHRANEKTDLRKNVWMDGEWRAVGPSSDISLAEVTGAFNRMIAEGIDVKSTPLVFEPVEDVPPHAVKGVVAVQKRDFPAYRLGLGSEVRILGTSIEMWLSQAPKERVRQPLALRVGVVASSEEYMHLPGTHGDFLIDARIQHCFSGGPVFATVKSGILEYPAFVGVVSAYLKGVHFDAIDGREPELGGSTLNSGYGVVVPFDAFFPGL